jgi:hypothetical protein
VLLQQGHNPRKEGLGHTELLERTSFLRALAEYAAEARQGDGRLVLVSGESGMGKTALVEAFQADLSGARWLGARAMGCSRPGRWARSST